MKACLWPKLVGQYISLSPVRVLLRQTTTPDAAHLFPSSTSTTWPVRNGPKKPPLARFRASMMRSIAAFGLRSFFDFKVAPYWPRHRLIWGFTQRSAMYLSGSDWAETSVIGSQHIGAPKLGMGPRASNRFRRCSVSAVSGGGTALAQEPYKVCRSDP